MFSFKLFYGKFCRATTLEEMWASQASNLPQLLAVVEEESSYTGRELILDFSNNTRVSINSLSVKSGGFLTRASCKCFLLEAVPIIVCSKLKPVSLLRIDLRSRTKELILTNRSYVLIARIIKFTAANNVNLIGQILNTNNKQRKWLDERIRHYHEILKFYTVN